MWSRELVATATDSPRYSPGGGFRKFGTDVNGISGTPVIVALSCACAAPAHSTTASAQVDVKSRFIDSLPGVWQMVGFLADGLRCRCGPYLKTAGPSIARARQRAPMKPRKGPDL